MVSSLGENIMTAILLMFMGVFGFVLWADDRETLQVQQLGVWLLCLAIVGLVIEGVMA
jgi:hypothetical protein